MDTYFMAGNCDPIPTEEQWDKWMQEAPPEQALKLLQHAYSCLCRDVRKYEGWGVLFGIAERVLEERRIKL